MPTSGILSGLRMSIFMHRPVSLRFRKDRDESVVHLSNNKRINSIDLVVVSVRFEHTSLGDIGITLQIPLSNKAITMELTLVTGINWMRQQLNRGCDGSIRRSLLRQ